MIQIKNRWDDSILYQSETAETVKEALEEAVANEVCLNNASLVRARLDGARLDGARLDGASLVRARLDGASLVRARLDGASLDGASLDGASLDGASLTPIQNDFEIVLLSAVSEIPGLRLAITEGRINGSTYSGDCACLVGTIANVRKCGYTQIPGLKPDSNRPIERFFLAINKGDKPENSQFAALAVQWIDQFTAKLHHAVEVLTPELGYIKQ